MPTTIDHVTDEQKAQIDPWIEQWKEISLSNEPMNFELAKEAAANIYKYIDADVPEILPAASPREAIDIAKERLPDINDPYNYFYSGNLWSAWGAFISYFRDVLDWESETLEGFKHNEILMKNAHWVWWHEDLCIIVDRPTHIKRDDKGRLHSENEPSIGYRDGWGLYMWHGTRVPKEWILEPDKMDATIALTWENIEQRRCAAEIIGWNKVLDQLDAKIIDDDGDPEIGVLVEVEIPDIGPERFLRVRCGTGRDFALPVPPEMETALEAQSWTWGIDQKEFIKPEVRT
jgi:hypothetical protein